MRAHVQAEDQRDHREAVARGPSRVRSDDDLWWRSPARGGGATACGGASQPAVEELRVGPN